MARHCPECGFQNAEGANYCQRCGAFIGQPATGSSEPTTATYRIDEATGELVPVRWWCAPAAAASGRASRSTATG